jgi:predicted tellurium resistance membrane protein TerC
MFTSEAWLSLIPLTFLELVLGIDNLIFIAIVVGRLPVEKQAWARQLGLTVALVMRIGLIFALGWVMQLTTPLFHFMEWDLSGKDLLMLLGGLFLLYKATNSIHEELGGEVKAELKQNRYGFLMVIVQIALIDLVFSFDSVITAVGLTPSIPIIIMAMSIAMVGMMLSSSHISYFINQNPSFKMLALAFILMVGLLLIVEGFGVHVPKGYIYFAMFFSMAVESLNTVKKRKGSPSA